MSTRALRRLQRDENLSSSAAIDKELQQSAEGDDAVSGDDDIPGNDVIGVSKPTAVNLFDLLNDAGDHDSDENDENVNNTSEQTSSAGGAISRAQNSTGAKPKKKKKKKLKDSRTNADSKTANVGEDDIDATIKAVNEMLGDKNSVHAIRSNNAGRDQANTKSVLFIEHRLLNPDNEVRRLFGTHVVQSEQRKHRNTNKHRGTHLARYGENWPVFSRTGLSMQHVDSSEPGVQYFAFEHSKAYQKIQFDFLDSVESLNPQNIANLHNQFPYHIDTLLQLGEIFKMSEDRQAATEMIERALYMFERNFHPLFSLTRGDCRLDYRITENRPFYLALWRYAVAIGRKGCYRTALEYCKLILSFDPTNDPLCMVLLIDFYALRSEQYDFLIRLYHEWNSPRSLTLLPNFSFSVPLAMFHVATRDGTSQQAADDMLQNSILMYPGLLLPLLDKCSIVADKTVREHKYFNSDEILREAEGLKQLQTLYIGRCESCWKEPAVMTWLETNVHAVINRLAVNTVSQEQTRQFANYRSTLYVNTPRNVLRHIVLSEIKEAVALLPPDVRLSPILSYDPLPPLDSIVSYKRPEKLTRAQESSNPLSLFFRSLAPNFNPQEPVAEDANGDEAAGAAGGRDLRHGVTALMDVMRELLNSIHFIPPPVVNRQDGGEEGDNGEERRDAEDGEEDDWN